jgi:hypothetical protein
VSVFVVRLNPSVPIALLIDAIMSLPMAIEKLLSRESLSPFRMRKFISGAPYRRFPRHCGGLDTCHVYGRWRSPPPIKLHLVSDLKSFYAALAIVQVMYGSLLMEGDRLRRRIGRG